MDSASCCGVQTVYSSAVASYCVGKMTATTPKESRRALLLLCIQLLHVNRMHRLSWGVQPYSAWGPPLSGLSLSPPAELRKCGRRRLPDKQHLDLPGC